MLTKALAEEWSKYNIRVNMVAPGYTRTKMCPTGPKDKNVIPLGRMAEPEEMVGTVIYLASDASSYVIGQQIIVDGGYTICGSSAK
jgi:NAD(P)-dependent dehydrogenase (short-subunit alcohol dehydrogenase family)